MKAIKLAILIISLLAFAVSASAKSPLWKVSKGDDYLFIGGTIHMLNKNDYPLPVEFETIYNQSEHLVFETDMEKIELPETQEKMSQKMRYQDGSTLKDHLSPKTYEALVDYLNESDMPTELINLIKEHKPAMASLMLTVHELIKLGVDSPGVDDFYYKKAKKDSKSLGKLETVDQQLNFIAALGENNPDEFIAYTLRDIKQLPQLFNELKTAWKTGDIQTLDDIGILPMKKDFPSAYQNIVVQRNNAWIPQIEMMIKTKEIEMILVGALHLAGEDSVLEKLKKLGYTIEQY
ncbi:MAG: TraB/GumN family protein [Thiomicrorhabdus sp.]|nr:TraB/GumN family protein [Thiomicrorhabdus sp.]